MKAPLENIFKLNSLEKLDLSGCSIVGYEEKLCYPLPFSKEISRITDLNLSNCKLLNVPSAIGSLVSLQSLNLDQNKFSSLPATLGNLHHLRTLNLNLCFGLESILDLPRNLAVKDAQNCTRLMKLPSSMSELKSLKYLSLKGCSKLGYEDPLCLMKLSGLSSLEHLNMGDCNVSNVPAEIGSLVSLRRLTLRTNKLSTLPASLGSLHCLTSLEVDRCAELKSIEKLPENLTRLGAEYCKSLERISFAELRNNDENVSLLMQLKLSKCLRLVDS